jgi:penicillin-binding protein 1C
VSKPDPDRNAGSGLRPGLTNGLLWRLALELILLVAVVGLLVPLEPHLVRGRDFASLVVLDRNGARLREVRSGQDGVANWVGLKDISPYLVQATLESEDRRFYQHAGIDLLGVGRALLTNLRAGRIRAGGSTITQQLARSIRPRLRRSLPGKLCEAWDAVRLEWHLSKAQILEAYLNRVPYGNQTFGAEAASRLYFAKSAAQLSLAEAAFLAAIPRAPSAADPYRRPQRTRERQLLILAQLRRRHVISDLQYRTAVATLPAVVPREQNFQAPHFVDWVGSRPSDQDSAHAELRTTLDLNIQQPVERLLRRHVRALRGNNVTNGAVIVMKTGTGEILAMAGSADYFDAVHDGQVNAALAERQPGSTLKPFTYELALEQGATASDLLADLDFHAREPAGDYVPRNYDEQFHGPVRLRTALACSYNIPAVRVAEQLGTEQLLGRLHALGFSSLDRPARHYGLGLTLGDGAVSLLELCRAYHCLALGGRYVPERVECGIRNAEHRDGVLSPAAAYVIADILSDNSARVPAFGQYSALNLGFPCAAKTGTSKDYRDNWTIGFSTEYVVGVWVGNFDGSPMHGVSGITGAGPLFRDIMLFLHPTPPLPFGAPPDVERYRVCSKSGQLGGPDCANALDELFIAGHVPTETCSVHRRCHLDARTGRLAVASTPAEYVADRVYEVYPPLYHAWMQSQGLPFPPVADAVEPASDSGLQAGERLRIVFPDEEAVFKLDPDLAAEFQSVELQAEVPTDCAQLEWRVDGAPLASVERPFLLYWPLTPGRHRISCRTADGRSDEVAVLVLR